ncbi:MAG: hypothetical protein AAF629_11985, partial [Chloroflexota bacterium]
METNQSEALAFQSENLLTSYHVIQAALVHLALVFLFFWPAIVDGQVIIPSDLAFDDDLMWQSMAPNGYTEPSNALLADQLNQFYPWQALINTYRTELETTLWNPYSAGGHPLIGNAQSSLFDLFTIFGRLFPFPYSITVTTLLRLFCAGLFMYLFARGMGIRHSGAILGMVTFAFCSPVVVWIGYPLASVIVWLPALLFVTERFLQQTTSKYWFAGALVIGFQFLGGHPETSFLVLLTWGLFSFYRMIQLKGWSITTLLSTSWLLGTMLVLGTCLSAVQLIPFLETLWHSTALSGRLAQPAMGGFDWRTIFFDWQAWPSLITFILPDYFGTPKNNTYWLHNNNYNEATAYVGILPLVLAFVLTVQVWRDHGYRYRSTVLAFSVATIVMVGMAFNLPIFNIINDLPIFSISNNGRLRLVCALFIATLAGYAFDYGFGQPHRSTKLMQWSLWGIGTGSLLLIGMTYVGFSLYKDTFIQNGFAFIDARQGTPYLSHSIDYYYDLVVQRQDRRLSLFHPTHIRMYLPILFPLVPFGLRYVDLSWKKLTAQFCSILLIILVVVDLFSINIFYNPTTVQSMILPETETIRFLQQDESIFRINAIGPIFKPNRSVAFELADIRGYDPMFPRRYVTLINHMAGFFPIGSHLLFTNANADLLDLLNVKYVLADQPLAGKWERVFQAEGQPTVYQNSRVMPRAFLVDDFVVAENEAAALQMVT